MPSTRITRITDAIRYGEGDLTREDAAQIIVQLSAAIACSSLINRAERIDAYTLLDQAADRLVPGCSDAELDPAQLAHAMSQHFVDMAEDERRAA